MPLVWRQEMERIWIWKYFLTKSAEFSKPRNKRPVMRIDYKLLYLLMLGDRII